MRRIMGITQSAFDPASRFRFIQFIPHLRKCGWEVDHRPNRPDRQWTSPLRSRLGRALHYRAGRAAMTLNRVRDVLSSGQHDVVFSNRDLAGSGLLCEKLLKRIRPQFVYDFDDAIFVGRNEPAVRWMCRQAGWVTPGNDYLADYARQHTGRVTVIPTVIDTDHYVARDPERPDAHGRVRVGWSGSDQSIQTTLGPHLRLLAALQAKVDFELVVITNTKPCLTVPNLRWSYLPWRADEEPFLEKCFDIGIMPLANDAFQKGKCGLKLLQYMAAGLPTVGSPVGVNRQIVQSGITGLLAETASDWHQALETLIQDGSKRRAFGCAGRRRCEQHYSIRRWLPVLLEIFQSVVKTGRNVHN